MASRARVIAHVDLDAFYTQVEVKCNPALKGKPVVVVQYNPWGDWKALRADEDRLFPESNGSIIAVSYEARKFGVKRYEQLSGNSTAHAHDAATPIHIREQWCLCQEHDGPGSQEAVPRAQNRAGEPSPCPTGDLSSQLAPAALQ
jgi:hypothetical protein